MFGILYLIDSTEKYMISDRFHVYYYKGDFFVERFYYTLQKLQEHGLEFSSKIAFY
jgi:hypothetical protein